MISLIEEGRYWKVIPPVDDNSAVFSKAVANLRPVSLMYTVDRHLVHDR